MATVQLNLELTDKQYNDLMTKGYEKIIGSDETTAAIRDALVTGIEDFLKANQDVIRNAICTSSGYWRGPDEPIPVVQEIVRSAAADSSDKLKDAVSDYLSDLVKTSGGVEKFLIEVLSSAILEGILGNVNNWNEHVASELNRLRDNVQSIASRLGTGVL